MSRSSALDEAIEAAEDLRPRAETAEELVDRHGHLLNQMAERDDDYGAIARAALKAGGNGYE